MASVGNPQAGRNGLPDRPLQARAEGNVDWLVHRRFFPRAGSGKVFVDVGAARPDYLSTSALFRSLGWKILSIEPNPAFCAMHRQKGHEVLQYACGDHDQDDVEFQVVDSHGAAYSGGKVSFESFSSLSIKDTYRALMSDETVRTIRVSLRRLDTILETHAPWIDRIDILSVDVEGWEMEVLKGLSLERYQPRVVILENLMNTDSYRNYMEAKRYVFWRRVPPNDVYAAPEWVGWLERRISPAWGRLVSFAKEALK